MSDSESDGLREEIQSLENVNEALLKSIQLLEDKITRCPRTGLFNEDFFGNYIRDIFSASLPSRSDGTILFVSIDNFGDINLHYGSDNADAILKKYAAYLGNSAPEKSMLFRLSGALFACYLPGFDKETAIQAAESIRVASAEADIFICFITVSIGVISFEELYDRELPVDTDIADFIIDAGKQRLNIARKRGANHVCADSNIESKQQERPAILLADANIFRLQMLAGLFPENKFDVTVAKTGAETLDKISNLELNLIIADFALPGMSAVEIKRDINKYSRLMGIPFIVITDHKYVDTLKQAYAAGVLMVIERPIFIDEILAIAENFSKGKFL